MKSVIVLISLILQFNFLSAQTTPDALRFSRMTGTGTARSAAMGGAFGALGGDLSSIHINPAGTGVYRKAEISYTSALDFSLSDSEGLKGKNNAYLIGSAGLASGTYDENNDWRSWGFGVTYNQLANFNQRIHQQVTDSPTSLTDVYAAQSNGVLPENLNLLNTALFYDSYLTYRTNDGLYHSILETDGETAELVNQNKSTREKGFLGELAFSFGTNYRDKLYLGAQIGVQVLNYKMNSYYCEIAEADAPSLLDYYDFNEYRKLEGAGINGKLGVIYRPIPEFRFAAAFHTPTWFSVESTLENSVYSQFTTETDASVGREYPAYEYISSGYDEYNDPDILRFRMRTPWRAVLSFGTVLAKRLILSADYEYVNYTTTKYNKPRKYAYKEYEEDGTAGEVEALSKSMDYAPINREIKERYRPTHNFRAGAELRLTSFLSLRGGYAYQDSPYKQAGKQGKIQVVSGGFGFNYDIFFCDAAFTQRLMKDQSWFYNTNGITASPVGNKLKNNEFRLTVGVKIPTLF